MSKVNTSMTTTEGQKHNTRLFKYGTTEFQFLWDPFLTEYEVMKVLGAKNKEKPALLVFRSGIWYQGTNPLTHDIVLLSRIDRYARIK